MVRLVEPGLRRNPRRAHLLVSTVLGKHIPVAPDVVIGAADRLGATVRGVLGGVPVDVLGMAETATGLGHCVATYLDAVVYIHTTRRTVPGAQIFATFEEGHSHATTHTLLPHHPAMLTGDRPLVIVDDETSTGATALAAIRVLHGRHPRPHYVLASLVDMRDDAQLAAVAATAAELGTSITSVSLATGSVTLPPNLVDAVHALDAPALNPVDGVRGTCRRAEVVWPAGVPHGGRHGFLDTDRHAFDAAVDAAAGQLTGHVDPERTVVMVGHEELMYLPLRVAGGLAARGVPALFQSTTRSPAYVLDIDGYPLRRGFRFHAPELDEEAPRFLYNARPIDDPASDPLIVLMIDAPADTAQLTRPGGVLDVLNAAGHDVLTVVVR